MKKVMIGIIAVMLLAGVAAIASNLGKDSEAEKTPQDSTPPDEVITKEETTKEETAGEETNMSETDQNGVILFKVEDYTIKRDSVVLTGKKCGAFLWWTPDEDFVTSYDVPTEVEVPNEVTMDYYTEYNYYAAVEFTGGEMGHYFGDIYKNASIKAQYIYLHMQNGEVVYI